MNAAQLAANIRKHRESKGYTQEYMAMKLNISQKAYSKVERQQTQMHWQKLQQIAGILELDVSQLIQSPQSRKLNSREDTVANFREKELWSKLESQYQARIENLEAEVAFLRKLVAPQIEQQL